MAVKPKVHKEIDLSNRENINNLMYIYMGKNVPLPIFITYILCDKFKIVYNGGKYYSYTGKYYEIIHNLNDFIMQSLNAMKYDSSKMPAIIFGRIINELKIRAIIKYGEFKETWD